jgi:hypothetical protein
MQSDAKSFSLLLNVCLEKLQELTVSMESQLIISFSQIHINRTPSYTMAESASVFLHHTVCSHLLK